jgi:hypothetical protein
VIFISGMYADGLKNGKWIYYKETMQTVKTEEYIQGRMVKQEILDEELKKELKNKKIEK